MSAVVNIRGCSPRWHRLQERRAVQVPQVRPVVNHALGATLATMIGAGPGECYLNALKALPFVPRAQLVVGFAASLGSRTPLRHAWLEVDDGRTIVEVTPTWLHGGVYYAPACRYGGRTAAARYRRLVCDAVALDVARIVVREALRTSRAERQEDALLREVYADDGAD